MIGFLPKIARGLLLHAIVRPRLLSALFILIGACSKPVPSTPAPTPAPTPTVTTSAEPAPQTSISAEYLGWYQSQRCVHDWVPEEKPIWFRIAHDHVDMLAEDYAERLMTELTATKQDDWNVFTGKVEVGKAIWMTDGFVIVQGPLVSPRTRQRYANHEDLKTIHRRLTFTEQSDGMVVSIIPTARTGHHSQFGWLECQIVKLPDELQAQYDEWFLRETGPSICKQATACCQAIRATGRRKQDDDYADICDAHPELTARYCRSWITMAVEDFRWGYESTCAPQRDGSQLCSIGERPKKPRVVPTECVSAGKSDAPASAGQR